MPQSGRMTDVWRLYDDVATAFDRDRKRLAGEESYLREALSGREGVHVRVLDLGCGSGEPIARTFIESDCHVTGVDAAPAMLAICRARFPSATWIEHDMRTLSLGRRFDAIVAWDSFFHLGPDEQRGMFPIFREHVAPQGMLLFTSGPAAGEAIGSLYGRELYHASLGAAEYQALLAEHGFEVVLHRVEGSRLRRPHGVACPVPLVSLHVEAAGHLRASAAA